MPVMGYATKTRKLGHHGPELAKLSPGAIWRKQPPRGAGIQLSQKPADATSFWHFDFEMRKSD
jgi:hypothetical protein